MRYLLRPFVLWWRYFPQLAALYLLGWLGPQGRHRARRLRRLGQRRLGVADHAVRRVGPARLVRGDVPRASLRHSRTGGAAPAVGAKRRRFATIIVPFFAIYLAWKLFAEDWLDFETAALNYRIGDAMTRALETGGPAVCIRRAAGQRRHLGRSSPSALVLRYVLGKFKESLPGWMIAVRVYVDALWVFLTLSFAASQGVELPHQPHGVDRRTADRRVGSTTLVPSCSRISSRWKRSGTPAMAVVADGVRRRHDPAAVACRRRDHLRRSDAGLARRGAPRRRRPGRQGVRARGRRPEEIHRAGLARRSDCRREDARMGALQAGQLQHHRRFGAADPARRRARVDAVHAAAISDLAWLDMAGAFYHPEVSIGYLFRFIAWLLGPHPMSFWDGFSDTIALISHMIVEPLRVCLIASTVAYCLEQVRTDADYSSNRTVIGAVERGDVHRASAPRPGASRNVN